MMAGDLNNHAPFAGGQGDGGLAMGGKPHDQAHDTTNTRGAQDPSLADLDFAALAGQSIVIPADRDNGSGPHDPARGLDQTFTGPAIWRNATHDEPVTVTGFAGQHDGRLFFAIAESKTAIPGDELTPNLPAQTDQDTATRLIWGGWRKGQAIVRRGKVKYLVTPDGQALDVRVTTGQGKGHVDLTLDLKTPNPDDAGAELVSLGLTLADARADLAELAPMLAAHPQPAKIPTPHKATSLADFAPWVNDQLGDKYGRNIKDVVAYKIRAWLLRQGRLLFDLGEEMPYLLADDGRALPLDDKGLALRSTLAETGINPTEVAFSWLLADLQTAAFREGRQMRLARWTLVQDRGVLVSCGPTGYVRTEADGRLTLHRNGDGDVFFAADASLPAWDPTAKPVDPLTLTAFSPAMTAPFEAPSYTPEVQRLLLSTWLPALLANLRPLPLLAALGGKGGGKSTLARAILITWLGPEADLTPLSEDDRDFWALAAGRPLFGLDNVDATPAKWLPDALAVAVTGGRKQGREYFTTGKISDRPIRAAVIVTSRTAVFARADVAERTLPMLTGELTDDARQGDNDLKGNVAGNRDGILVYLAQAAANLLAWQSKAPAGLPHRFVDFAKLVWSWCAATDQEAAAVPCLQAWAQAQRLAVGDADPLLAAILEFGPGLDSLQLGRVSPATLVSNLSHAGASIPLLGGSKAIARALRELRGNLALAGWQLKEDNSGGRLLFTLTRKP